MIRYYGTDYRDMLNAQFAYFRDENNVKPSAYSSGITNVSVDPRFVTLRDNARNAALMANTHVCNIQGTGLSAINEITSFYDSVDTVSNSIYVEASLLFGVLNNVLSTINNLCVLLHSAKRGYSYVTIEAINNACEPLNTAKNQSVAAALANLYNSDGTINEDNLEVFRSAMAAMGISDLTDEEIALLYKIYNILLDSGMSPEDIIDYLPYICSSAEFDQLLNNPYVAGNSEAYAQNMAGLIGRVKSADNVEVFNYMVLVDNLLDENGAFNQDVLIEYRSTLAEMGITGLTDEQIFAYLVVVEELRSRGYSDEVIYEWTPRIFAFEDLASVDGSADNSAFNTLYNDWLVSDRLRTSAEFVSNCYISTYSGLYQQGVVDITDPRDPLYGYTLRPDCSSFVSLILYREGFVDGTLYDTVAYAPGNTAGNQLQEHGFVWIPIEDSNFVLQEGDILLDKDPGNDGHIEIFSHYGENGSNSNYYSYTWGAPYEELPTSRSGISRYQGVWRYVG